METRRSFVTILASGLAAVPVLGAAFLAVRAALTPARSTGFTRLPLCRSEDVPASGFLVRVVQYQQRRGPAVENVSKVVLLSRDPQGTIYALSGECTHMRCPVSLNNDDPRAPLLCRCHDATFAADGTVLSGPPTRPLPRMPIEVPEGNKGMIHLLES